MNVQPTGWLSMGLSSSRSPNISLHKPKIISWCLKYQINYSLLIPEHLLQTTVILEAEYHGHLRAREGSFADVNQYVLKTISYAVNSRQFIFLNIILHLEFDFGAKRIAMCDYRNHAAPVVRFMEIPNVQFNASASSQKKLMRVILNIRECIYWTKLFYLYEEPVHFFCEPVRARIGQTH